MTIYKYFAKEVFLTMLTVAGVVLVISMTWRFSGYLNEAASGFLTTDVLFLIMAYRLPGFLELIVPISFFLSIMLTYGRLYVDSEMIVLQACGMSPARLVWITLVLASMVTVLTACLSLWLKPAGEQQVEKLFEGQRSLTEFDTLASGRFQMLRSGRRVTYTEELRGEGNLAKVFINERRDSGRTGARDTNLVVAETGTQHVDEKTGARFLVLRDGIRYQGKPGDLNYQVIQFEEYGQLLEKEQSSKRLARRTAIPTAELIASDNLRNISELQWRISIIMLVPIIALIAVPLSKVNPRLGRFTALVPGLILCFLYVVLLSSSRSALEKGQIPVQIGLWWVHPLFLMIGIGLFYTASIQRWISSLFFKTPDSV